MFSHIKARVSPIMLAKKNVPFKVIRELSFLVTPTISQLIDPKVKQIYPASTIPKAIRNAPKILAIVPVHAILFIISLCGKGLGLGLIVP